MPPQARVGDQALVAADAHGCPACPHTGTGPALAGSADVLANGLAAIRVGDSGMISTCCSPNTWTASAGSRTVLINHHPAHRLGDKILHLGLPGSTVAGSPDVLVGDAEGEGAGDGQPASDSDEVPHDRHLQISLLDDYSRKLDKMRLTVRCPHKPPRYLHIKSGDTVDSLCLGASVEVESLHENIVRY